MGADSVKALKRSPDRTALLVAPCGNLMPAALLVTAMSASHQQLVHMQFVRIERWVRFWGRHHPEGIHRSAQYTD